MKALFVILAVAAPAILIGAPGAEAFQTVQSSSVPTYNAPRVADPDDLIKENMDHQASANGSVVMPLGESFRFGMSSTDNRGADGRGLFLQNPASRTVPSQAPTGWR